MIRYLVTALRTPAFQPSLVADHLAFIDALRRDGQLERSGAFTDASGGAYILKAANLDEARAVAFSDPAHTSGGWAITVYEWDAG